MKPILIAMLALLVVPVAAKSQALPSIFFFSRERNNARSTSYVLKQNVPEIHKKVGGPGRPYQVLAAVVSPDRQAAILLFANAQKKSQLYSQADKSVTIKADSVEFKYRKYALAGKTKR